MACACSGLICRTGLCAWQWITCERLAAFTTFAAVMQSRSIERLTCTTAANKVMDPSPLSCVIMGLDPIPSGWVITCVRLDHRYPMSMENPYKAAAAGKGSEPIDSRIAPTYYACLLLLTGFLLFTYCTFNHICMCGHLKHTEAVTLPFHWGLDVLLGSVFALAVYFARRSFFVHPTAIAFLLALIYADHVLLASGAGYLFSILDLPIMLLIAARCVTRLRLARIYATAV